MCCGSSDSTEAEKHAHTALQHTATHCNTHTFALSGAPAYALQHTATHCNTLQHTATHCNTLQHSRTHSHSQAHQHTHCNRLNPLQHTLAHQCTRSPPQTGTSLRGDLVVFKCIVQKFGMRRRKLCFLYFFRRLHHR